MKEPVFIRPMHPKTEIRPHPEAIDRILKMGWVGQLKIHGHRAQIHISSDPAVSPIAFNRHGKRHFKLLTSEAIAELQRLFTPTQGWNVIDTEWLKKEDHIYVFDFIKKDGQILNRLKYLDRLALLPKDFISPVVKLLPIYTTLEECLRALEQNDAHIEGLVFKSTRSAGFADTSVVRCRKNPEYAV